jgi:tetratricopeptide (TPR) repeat protein
MLARWLLAIAILMAARPSAAQQAAPPPGEEGRTEAERLFEEANRQFHEGQYRAAIPLFQRAYDLSSEAALIFNIAQSYRLAGDCRPALASYRRFVELTADQALRTRARGHIERLAQTCPAPAPPVAEVVVARPARAAEGAPSPWPKVGLAVVGAGLLAGGGAAGLYLWNGSRYRRWDQEDRRLRGGEGPLSPERVQGPQQANDELWRSIARTDRASLGLAIAGGALVAGGAVLWWSSRTSERSTSAAFTGNGFVGSVRW